MNKYVHAVGFCVGLVAVILVSAVDGALMTDGWLTVNTPLNRSAYSLCWLVSYVLSAAAIGEFAINKQLRKYVFIPLVVLLFTALSFWAFYRLHSFPLNAVFLGITIIAESFVLFLLIKKTRYSFAGSLVNLLWYCYLLGIDIVLWVVA